MTEVIGLEVDLVWEGDQRFAARSGTMGMVLDGNASAGPSPVQALAFALASCMAIDVVEILSKGRHDLRALRARLEGDRAKDPPRRFLAVRLHFVLTGELGRDKVERAIALSREKYCSVWHSLRQDIQFTTSFEIEAPAHWRSRGSAAGAREEPGTRSAHSSCYGDLMSAGPSPHDLQAALDREPKRLLSVEEYHRMIAAGVVDEDEHVELLEGVIVEMSPQRPRHAEVIRRLCDSQFAPVGPGYLVQAQLPLSLGQTSEPEPDVAIVPRRAGGYGHAHPTTALLVFEVAEDSLRKDRLVKAPLYARAGIPEYAIVNLQEGGRLEVYRDPDPEAGQYRSRVTLGPADCFVSTAVPGYAFEGCRLLA
jgi:uncharacterized OsmC-like protein/Uma2 family endonuclease